VNLSIQANGGHVRTRILADGATASAIDLFPYITDNANTGIMADNDWVFPAAPGTHTDQFQVAVSSAVPAGLLVGALSLTATTHPFGNSGATGAIEIQPTPPEPAR
jgi:hypothetical protein